MNKIYDSSAYEILNGKEARERHFKPGGTDEQFYILSPFNHGWTVGRAWTTSAFHSLKPFDSKETAQEELKEYAMPVYSQKR